MKKLQERYGRFHARFPLDDVYLALPRGLRNDAYLYLLALSGHRRAEEADSNVPRSVADAIAQAMGLNPERMLTALGAVKRDGKPRVLAIAGDIVRLLKHDKWQDTPEQIAELKVARSEAGRRGAEVGWDRKRQQTTQQLPQQSSSNGPANAGQVLQQNPAETETETETESLNASRSYIARGKDAPSNGYDDATFELAKGMQELFTRTLSTVEVIECQGALNQYAYMSAKDLIARAGEHQDYCRDKDLPPARTVAGFTDSWRRENDHRSDEGLPKVQRASVSGRQQGMARVGDLLSSPPHSPSPQPPQERA